MPSPEDARLAARGAHHRPLRLAALAVRAARREPAGAAVQRDASARRRLDRDARQARARSSSGRAPAAASPPGGATARVPCIEPFWASIAAAAPSPGAWHSQPKNSSPAMAESGRWRTVTALILRQLRRATAAGRRWRPRARARAWSAATPGRRCTRARPAARARRPRRPESGSFTESISTIWARSSSASTASGWPCGDHTSVARSVTTSGSTIVSRCWRCCGPTSSTTCSWHTASSPGLGSSSAGHGGPARRSLVGPARPQQRIVREAW